MEQYVRSSRNRLETIFSYTLLALALMECLSIWLRGAFTIVAAWMWLTLGLGILVISVFTFIKASIKSSKLGAWGYLISTCGAVFMCFWGIGDYAACCINYESTIQLPIGLYNIQRADLGYHELGFLAYPSRQYILAAIPAYLMGASLLTLRLGYALFFFLSWVVFSNGLRHWIESSTSKQRAYDLAGLFSASLLTFPILAQWIRIFEQSLIPISLTCFVLGFGMSWVTKRRTSDFIGLAWSCGMLGTSYTPSLAVWALALVIFVRVIITPNLFRHPLPRLSVYALLSYTFVLGLVNLLSSRSTYKESLSLTDSEATQPLQFGEIVDTIIEGFAKIFVSHKAHYFGGILFWPMVMLVGWIVLAPRIRNHWHTWAIVGWCVSTIMAAVLVRGYQRGVPDLVLHRGMVIIPILVIGMYAAIHKLMVNQRQSLLIIACLVFFGTTLWLGTNTKDIWGTDRYEPRFNEDLLSVTLDFAKKHSEETAIYLAPNLPIGGTLHHQLGFLSPTTLVQYGRDIDAEKSEWSRPTLGVFTATDPFLEELRASGESIRTIRKLSREEPEKEPFVMVNLR